MDCRIKFGNDDFTFQAALANGCVTQLIIRLPESAFGNALGYTQCLRLRRIYQGHLIMKSSYLLIPILKNKITRRRAEDSTGSTARRANAVRLFFRIGITLPCALLLAACTPSGMSIGIGGGSHFGIGTSLHFPLGQNVNNSGLNISEEQIITFFDANFKAQRSPAKGGYYRELLAKRPGKLYLVQDFYEDSRRKRTDPMLLQQSQLMDFYAYPADGSHSVYYNNGNLATQTQYQNGKAVRSESWPQH